MPVLGHHCAPGVIVEQKYELVRLLGEGGMGAVWVAKHLTLDVHVALKVMHGDIGQQVPGAADRMLQEARAAACIGHPAIVQVFDFGRTRNGDPFISMELLHGESLAQAVQRRGRLPAARALQVLLPIADALAVAHQRGIVHRDLKPDNVFLARLADGRVQPKILDFGIAKLETEHLPKLTVQGTVLGSPAYMAPEQAWGENDIDQRADVWAFSVMLYELLTGTVPFQADSYNALLFAITRNEPKPIAEFGVDSPELWQILLKGLAKDRAARFADMRELGRAFASYLLSQGIKTDITKAPIAPWLESRQSPLDASLFPSLLPHGSSAPPARGVVTQVAGSPVPLPEPVVATLPEPGLELASPQRTAEKKIVVPIERSPGVAMRFSFRRNKRAPADAAAARTSLGFEDPRFRQFVGVAVISAAVFVAAAWWQSSRNRPRAVSAPTPAAAPAPAPTPAPAQSSARTELERYPSPDGVPSIDFRASDASDDEVAEREPPRDRSATPRPRPKRRPASSADLKNPFR
jgi:serine/threonine protein kinase